MDCRNITTSHRWDNELSPYWQARSLAALVGYVSKATEVQQLVAHTFAIICFSVYMDLRLQDIGLHTFRRAYQRQHVPKAPLLEELCQLCECYCA